MNADIGHQRKKRKQSQRKNIDTLHFNQDEAFDAVGTKQKKLRTDKPSFRSITKSRLSMKAGMFQFGKRSDSFTSKVSEESKARANEDLKRILQLANPSSSPINDLESNHVAPELNIFRSYSDWNSILPGNKRKKTFSRDSSNKTTDSEFMEKEIEFPVSPPIETVADRLSSVFETKIKSLCLGRDCLEETKSELKLILAESKGIPLLLGPIQDLATTPEEVEVEGEEEEEDVVCYSLQNDYSPVLDQESMRGLKFLRLVEESNQERASSDQLTSYQCSSQRPICEEKSVCDQQVAQEVDEESSFIPTTGGYFCWSSQSAAFNHAGPKQMDFLDYLDRVNMKRKEKSCNTIAQPAWHSLMPIACTTSLSSRPPLLRSPSPPTYKFYRHRLY